MCSTDLKNSLLSINNNNDYLSDISPIHTTPLCRIQHQEIDCFTIVLGKKTGMTFPVDIHNQQVNALYDWLQSDQLFHV